MYTNYTFFFANNNKLVHGRLLVLFLNLREVKRTERGFVYAEMSIFVLLKRNNADTQILTADPYFWRASGSVRPTVPMVG